MSHRAKSNFSASREVFYFKISGLKGRGLFRILENVYEKASLLQKLQLVNYYIPCFGISQKKT